MGIKQDGLLFHFERRSLDLQSDSSRLKIAHMVSNIEYEVDVRDIEYQQQAGKARLGRIYQPKGTNHQDSLSTQQRRSRGATAFSRNTRQWHDSN